VETYTLQTDTEKDIGKSGTFDYYYLEAAVGVRNTRSLSPAKLWPTYASCSCTT